VLSSIVKDKSRIVTTSGSDDRAHNDKKNEKELFRAVHFTSVTPKDETTTTTDGGGSALSFDSET
jgi:hypothetical protein